MKAQNASHAKNGPLSLRLAAAAVVGLQAESLGLAQVIEELKTSNIPFGDRDASP